MLGKAEERAEQGKRVLVWTMKDHAVRRVEWGVPKMDRNVGVSFSTTTWDDVAHGLRETLASLEADSPEVTRGRARSPRAGQPACGRRARSSRRSSRRPARPSRRPRASCSPTSTSVATAARW